MTGPDMSTITSLLERSLQSFSLTNDDGESPENHIPLTSGAGVDLNSHISLPYDWEQCLDLKTGEVYYLNWKTGMQVKEDPRTTGYFYSEGDEDDDDNDDDDDSSYADSEESSSQSSPASYSRVNQIYQHGHLKNTNDNKIGVDNDKRESVLVVTGCKGCLMYFMVPKQDSICPKCCGQLLHFDQSENASV